MSDDNNLSKEDIMEQLQAGHRARLDGSMLQNWNKDTVQFHEVMPGVTNQSVPSQNGANRGTASQQPQNMQAETQAQAIPENYLNYAAQLLEQMRSVYASSWDNCSCGSTPSWSGGHNHFYDPCSGADNPPSSSCPVYDCNNTCCADPCPPKPPKPPKPQKPPYHPDYPDCGCGCGTTTYYDDCAYKLQKISDQLTRIETMTKEMYAVNQQLASYIIEYYNKLVNNPSTC